MRHLGALDSPSLYHRAPPSTERCLDQLAVELDRNRDPNALVRGYVSVYGLGTASDELLLAAKETADAHGVAFHQHENYTPDSSHADYQRLGRSRILHLAELGVLGKNATLIHVNVVRDEEIAPLVDAGGAVIWCPFAYLDMAISAQAPCRILELRDKGVTVAIATDGARECNAGDAPLAAYLVARNANTPVSVESLLEMQTIDAARSAGIDAWTGSIEVGKRADIVIRHAQVAQAWPANNVLHQLALHHRGASVDIVIVDGQIVLENGHSTRIDEARVYAQAYESVRARLRRLNLSTHGPWPRSEN